MKKMDIHRRELGSQMSVEALNAICSNLVFAAKDSKKIVFMGCKSKAGTGFMTAQIGCNLAKRGKQVLLVDANLRGGGKDDQKIGLLSCLEGKCEMEDALYETDVENAYLLPAGGQSNDSIPLLTGKRFSQLLEKAAAQFEMVLVMAPPIGEVIDAAEIAKNCDGAVLILKYNETTGSEAVQAKKQLQQAGCPILGCVLNQADEKAMKTQK